MYFSYSDENLSWLGVDLDALTQKIETELLHTYQYRGAYYLYNIQVLRERLSYLTRELPNANFYYSVKSLSNINILKEVRKEKNFDLDVVSLGEIKRGLLAGFLPQQIVFAGVGKTAQEIEEAIQLDIKSFHVESVSELNLIHNICRKSKKNARLALRLNPDIETETHHYIATGKKESKFGISLRELPVALQIIKDSSFLNLIGLQAHIGSQIKNIHTHVRLLQVLGEKAHELTQAGFTLEYLSLGGGFGVDYNNSFDTTQLDEFSLPNFAQELSRQQENTPWQISFEPGRFISAYAGILVSHVLYVKEKSDFQIAIVDAAMNDLIRPALYDAKHPLVPLHKRDNKSFVYDVVGPVCESGDFFRKGIRLSRLQENDTLFILHAGAYGSSMSSRYNSRRLLPEILIDPQRESGFRIIRKPETWEKVFSDETDGCV